MKRVHKVALTVLAALLGVAFFRLLTSAQTMGFGEQPATKFAAMLADCPTATSGYFTCIVVPADGTQPYFALSVAGFNSGAAFAVLSQGPKGDTGSTGATGAQGPPGPIQGFTKLNCGNATLQTAPQTTGQGLTADTCTEQ